MPHLVNFHSKCRFNGIVLCSERNISAVGPSSTTVLTSASCVHKRSPNGILAILGHTRINCDLRLSRTNFSIENIIVHESFSTILLRNNIALLQTVSEIEFSNQIQPVQLPINWSNDMNRNLTMTGWHRSYNIDIVTFTNSNQQLQYEDTSYVECKTKQTSHHDQYGIVCTENEFSGSEYTLDKGSLLTENNYLVGIISLDRYHNSGDPLTYNNISSYVPWIEVNLKVKESPKPESKSNSNFWLVLLIVIGVTTFIGIFSFRKFNARIATTIPRSTPSPVASRTPNRTAATSSRTASRIHRDRLAVSIYTIHEDEPIPSATPAQTVPTAPPVITPLPNVSSPITPPPCYDTLFPVKVEDDSNTRSPI
ncbi:chymotrypsin-2-like [Sitodiplosis mosellana]|uniref:chymotrypsin-2-like n=1 Tax=Sitodiplosis mosellana TaxID=263140 RepID=UPI0024441BA8|nr:chymotrypsin-2-like [Sitodiplosis mosellana]